MDARKTSADLVINKFTFAKQIKLFSSLRARKVSGQMSFRSNSSIIWHLYFYLGKIVYATGGKHPVRRWARTLKSNLPQINFQLSSLEQHVIDGVVDLNDNIWEYDRLSNWLQQNQIIPDQATDSILLIVREVCLDLIQTEQLICHLNQNSILYPKLQLIEPEEITEFNQQICTDAKLLKYNLDLSPIILGCQKFIQTLSPEEQDIFKLLSKKQTLKDLAIELEIPVFRLLLFLLPYLQAKVIDLIEVPNLMKIPQVITPESHSRELPTVKRPLIACIDDSLTVSHIMEKSISNAGYYSIVINNPIDATPTLLASKPDLILLDIMMPKMNGYQLCSQLRQYPELSDVPIIFLTGNNGIFNRLKAKIAGGTDFVNKTIDVDLLIQKIDSYLKLN